MSTETIPVREILEKLPVDSSLILRNVSWDEYETLLEGLEESSGVRVSYDRGILEIVTLSSEHESYCRLLEKLLALFSTRRRVRILSFGSSTMRRKESGKGTEPDACFYVQTAPAIGRKIRIDFGLDPAPDVVAEIDLSHDSLSKLPTYAALGVPEVWRYDGNEVRIYQLREGRYVAAAASLALPELTPGVLTDFLNRSRRNDQFEILLAFEEWLDTLPS
jgi:Uma2 family endonuclease